MAKPNQANSSIEGISDKSESHHVSIVGKLIEMLVKPGIALLRTKLLRL